MTIKIYDNFLPEHEFKKIQDDVLGDTFPWYFNDSIVDLNNASRKDFQFCHVLYRKNCVQSRAFDIFEPLFMRMNPFQIIRAKLNCNPYSDIEYESGMHTDFQSSTMPENIKMNSAVFYLNTNNGYTKFESSGKKLYSVENRLVTFPVYEKHTGSKTTDSKVRVVLNLNYIPF